jgi:hypothetical protein
MIARLADNEAKSYIDDMNMVLKGGNPNSAVRAQIKTICSEIGEVRCAKLSAEERVVDSEAFVAQKLIQNLYVSVLDVDKIQELLAIALRKTVAVSKLAGAVDLSAEDGADMLTPPPPQDWASACGGARWGHILPPGAWSSFERIDSWKGNFSTAGG